MSNLKTIELQLVWDRLLAIVEDQAQTLMRTAFSTVVREAGDLSAGVFDPDGRMLAQAITGTPGHVNAMSKSVGNFLAQYPLHELEEGDVLLTNDPWLATGHLNDFTVVTPVFSNSEVIGLFASTSHIADVGGRGFGPDANEVYEEGINVPVEFLFRRNELNETLMRLILNNVRDPIVAEGDLYSLTACNNSGAKVLLQTLSEFSIKSLADVSQRILDSSRRAMQDEIAKLPNGSYSQSMDVDGYDETIHIECSLSINDESIDIDFAGTSPTSSYGINVPMNYAEAYASFGVRCLVGNDVPNNAGSLDTIRVAAPPGSILNAEPPSAVSARHALGQMLPDVVIGCLEQVMPDRTPAEGASCIWNPVLLSDSNVSENYHSPSFVINPIFNGGTGARASKDGLSTTAFPSGVRTTPTEINEVTAPLIFWRREYLVDSGGSGKHRGGLGQIIEIEHAHGAPYLVSKMFERVKHPARGRQGGRNGKSGRVHINNGQELKGKGKDRVPAGARLILETPGGGGLGDPEDRSTENVRADLQAELVSQELADRIYRSS